MHHLLLITLTAGPAATSAEVREDVFNRLVDDPSFCGDGGRFGAPLCDWFVIGGRWSGLLKETLLGEPYRQAFERSFPQLAQGWVASSLVKERRDQLNRLWREFGGRDCAPLVRSGYEQLGYEDDAMIVDQTLYDNFLRERESESEGDTSRCRFADLDHDPVEESFIGRKWLVVIDYHN